MPKIYTNAERAAHLIQAYIDSDNGAKPNEDVQYIQSMKESLANKNQELANKNERFPITLQSMNMRYRDLDKELREAADYIKAGNVDPKVLYEKQQKISGLIGGLQTDHRSAKEAMSDPEREDQKLYKDLFGGYDNDKLDQIQADKGQNILHRTGETKSAYKWIESIYGDMKKPEDVTEEDVAMILAARQLGDAVYDHPENIKNNRISEAELKNHANKLKGSKLFQEYYKTVKNLDFKKTVKHGHGGYLEKTFEDFLVKSAAEGPLPFDAHDRYQKVLDAKWKDPSLLHDYKSYGDYFEKNKGNVVTSKEAHAARMAAAAILHDEDPNAPFDKKVLDAKAREWLKSPSFKLVTAMPGKLDMIINGDAPGFADSVQALKNSAKSLLNENGEFDMKERYPDLSLNRLKERMDENPDLKPVVESVEKLQNGKKEPQDVIKTVDTIMRYQDKHMTDNMGDMGRDMNNTLRLLHEITNHSPLNSIVQTQIDKTNKARNVNENRGMPLTYDMIAEEGREMDAALNDELGINKKGDIAMDFGHVNGPIA